MSTLNVNELNAPADHDFEIKFDDGESLLVAGTCNLHPLSHFKLPTGTTALRPSAGISTQGMMRNNTTLSKFEGYTYPAETWGTLGGGAGGGGADEIFVDNSMVVTNDYELSSGKSASSVGPITINSGVTVTLPSGQNWVIL